ncbi:type II toxin-antitoxin system RelE/ParE family toxin [Paenibacillus sp. GSMTC-2017]|uniref:type II toxin-antitoxin system RelE/ParE family toxin n=1 Tax=Paenibacillus sp. GSMTC-2017 TaxID=2794350 RepID=UPI0018D6EF54|nr:type II toxin-antitoxin system RelE/ParE family toxin [Paenibacillus sp. GSMTC-2017]MBH5317504.1 type II toxin-antitoxin system RelE/ParE family toxin [Paenibacillus sp. GSMTC-2017]
MEKKYTLRYLALAQSDLLDITNYISEQLFAPEAAIHLVEKFEEAISRLEYFPYSGRLYRSTGKLKDEYRILFVESYLIFYIILDNTVEIRRIIYSKRDYLKLL